MYRVCPLANSTEIYIWRIKLTLSFINLTPLNALLMPLYPTAQQRLYLRPFQSFRFHVECDHVYNPVISYRGADKALPRTRRKQATATDFDVHVSYLLS